MAGVCGGAVLLEPDRDVDVRQDRLFGLVVGDGAAAERFDVGQVHAGPDRRLRVVELGAGADDLGLGEARDEHWNVAVPDPVGVAELVEGGEEVLAVVEGHAEGSADRQFLATHARLPQRWWRWPATARCRGRRRTRPRRRTR